MHSQNELSFFYNSQSSYIFTYSADFTNITKCNVVRITNLAFSRYLNLISIMIRKVFPITANTPSDSSPINTNRSLLVILKKKKGV